MENKKVMNIKKEFLKRVPEMDRTEWVKIYEYAPIIYRLYILIIHYILGCPGFIFYSVQSKYSLKLYVMNIKKEFLKEFILFGQSGLT